MDGENFSQELLRKITDSIRILMVRGKNYPAATESALKKFKGSLNEEDVLKLMDNFHGNIFIAQAILRSGQLSTNGVIELLEKNEFNYTLCEIAFDDYGTSLADQLYKKIGKKCPPKTLDLIIERSTDLIFIAEEAGFGIDACRHAEHAALNFCS